MLKIFVLKASLLLFVFLEKEKTILDT